MMTDNVYLRDHFYLYIYGYSLDKVTNEYVYEFHNNAL